MTNDQFRHTVVEAARQPIELRKSIERSLAQAVPKHLSIVEELAASEEVAVRRIIVELLRRSAGIEPGAMSILFRRLPLEPDVKTRRRLAAAISSVPAQENAVIVLRDQLEREEHRFVQASLILALGKLGFTGWPDRWLSFLSREGPVAEAIRKAVGHASTPAQHPLAGPLDRPPGEFALNIYPGLERMVDLDLRRLRLPKLRGIGFGWASLAHVEAEALEAIAGLRTVLADFHIAASALARDEPDYSRLLEEALVRIRAGPGDMSWGATFRLALPRMQTKAAYTKLVTMLSRSVERATGWRNNPSDYVIDLRIVQAGPRVLALWRTRLWKTAHEGEQRQVIPASMHPTVAAGLCLAAVEPALDRMLDSAGRKTVLLDPACGSGTIIREWLALFPEATAIGYDLSTEAVRIARENLSGFEDRCTVEVADMRHTPLRSASVDYIATNLPFGIRIKHGQSNASLYEGFAKEALRLMREGGGLAAYSADRRALMQALGLAGWRKAPPYAVVHAGGLDVAVARVRRI